MVDTALIIAAGEAKRWGGRIKQLMPVGNETVIGRTIRLLRARGLWPVIVTHRQELLDACGGGFMPERRATILETILSTRPLWHGLTAIFFGDVIFSEDTLDLLWARERFPTFIGSGAENFIIGFNDHDGTEKAIRDTIARGGRISWHLYRRLAGLPMEPHFIPEPEKRVVYQQTDPGDYTDDIDTPAKYEEMLGKLRQRGVIDAESA